MRVAVTVREVAAVDDNFEVSGTSIPEQYLEYDLNEWDDYAVEEAVQLKEARDEDVEVVVVAIGPERSEETIRMALAKGADRAVRIWDDALADPPLLDVRTQRTVLAAALKAEDPDLVLTGVQASDDAFGATGVALAHALGYEWAAVVNDLDVVDPSEPATVHRELEGGLEEVTEVNLPAVFTIQTGINEPRYASLMGIRQAQSKELQVLDLDALGIDRDAITPALELEAMYKPTSESDAEMIEGGPDEAAGELAEIVRDAGVIEG